MTGDHPDVLERYRQTRDAMVARLRALEDLLEDPDAALVRTERERLECGRFVLAVVGEFSSGKSFLLNALLERVRRDGETISGLLAVGVNPSTAAVTELVYGDHEDATAWYPDGRSERVPVDFLDRFTAVGIEGTGERHAATADRSDSPVRVQLSVAAPLLRRGIVLADTPGLASVNPAHRRATLSYLPGADAVLYLIDTQQPFSDGDAAFLDIVRRHVASIFIVQTKIDLWEQLLEDGRAEWEHARDRIAALAAVHAPEASVISVSARRYAEGLLAGDATAIARSRFRDLLEALDRSLIARTGRARIRRALQIAVTAADTALDALRTERACYDRPIDELRDALEREHTAAERIAAELLAAADRLRESAGIVAQTIVEQGRRTAEHLAGSLVRAFDTADIVHLRDRARLHALADRATVEALTPFARAMAAHVLAETGDAIRHAGEHTHLSFSAEEALARAFGADASSIAWRQRAHDAPADAIVLEALSGPTVSLVHEIASRFAGAAPGTYMKRELNADLRAHIMPLFLDDFDRFSRELALRLRGVYAETERALRGAAERERHRRIGGIVRALAAHGDGSLREKAAALDATMLRIAALRAEIDDLADASSEERAVPAEPPAHAEIRAAHAAEERAFDPDAYERGLTPTRWRVALLGALRRGKSALIDAIAGRAILPDRTPGSARFPVHVRYGDRDEAFVLENGAWTPIEPDAVAEACTRAPVLRLVPWRLPRELVLVHTPAFDGGDPTAESIAAVSAMHASALLCLFSRQLSDRELAFYERWADLGRPIFFAHTFADNETPRDRREVVALAERYLRERGITAERIFTISSTEAAAASAAGRAPAPWNEFPALVATLESRAAEHMARLERLARARTQLLPNDARAPVTAQEEESSRRLWWRSIFAKGLGRRS